MSWERAGQVQGERGDLLMTARQPVLVGVGQLVNRAADPREVMEPLEMMAVAARRAAEDAEIPRRLAEVDSLTVINIISRAYADPPGFLAARLGITPRERVYTSMGGNSPQWRVNETADRIARGEVRLALIAGAEAMHGLQLARRAGVQLDWAEAGTPETVGDGRWGNNPIEQRHHAQMPTNVYPLFENALRAHRGWSIERHRAHLGELCARMAAVARDNPYAWFRQDRTAAEIAAVSPTNRMIAFPYPKFMNAIITVDQAAALLMTDVDTARALGIPEHKWVYVRGCGDATDHWFVSERVEFLVVTRHSARRPAGAGAGAAGDRRASTTSTSTVASRAPCRSAPTCSASPPTIRARSPSPAACPITAVPATTTAPMPSPAWSSGCAPSPAPAAWSAASAGTSPSTPSACTRAPRRTIRSSAWIRSAIRRASTTNRIPSWPWTAHGPGTVETYTVQHDRDGNPSVGIVVVRLADGRRCWANITDAAILERIEQQEFVGQQGQVRHDESTQVNVFEP